jgi:hypothetical protein
MRRNLTAGSDMRHKLIVPTVPVKQLTISLENLVASLHRQSAAFEGYGHMESR